MKILHFVEVYLQQTETFVYNFIRASGLCAETGVMAFKAQNTDQFPVQNMDCFILNKRPEYVRKSIAGFSRFLFEKTTGKKMWHYELDKIFRKYRPDVVHAHFGLMGLLIADYIANRKNVSFKLVTSFYGYDASSYPQMNLVYRRQLLDAWKYMDKVFAEGPSLKAKIAALGCPPEKIHLNPIIISEENYPKMEFKKPCNSGLRFLLIGRFVEKKGIHLFLQAIGQMFKDGEIDDFLITIIGDGVMADIYKAIINDYGFADKVVFEGIRSHKECIHSFLNHDVFVHPSVTALDGDSEGGAPTIIIEAQAVGIPVITSNHADIPFVMGYADFIAQENDIEDLKKVIAHFIECRNHNVMLLQKCIEMGRKLVADQHAFKPSQLDSPILKKLKNNYLDSLCVN